jgi:GTP-binding protein Era
MTKKILDLPRALDGNDNVAPPPMTRAGFVAIIGPTNAGKSTLLNQIMGQKVSIVSHKVQTTRTRLRAVKMVGATQLIFIDTPGIFKPSRRLDRAMVSAAMDAVKDANAVLLLADATHGMTPTVRDLAARLSQRAEHGGASLFAVLNKTDAVKKQDLLPIAAELASLAPFREIFMSSALTGDGVGPMVAALTDAMPESPYLFDPQDKADIPDDLYLAEITREKIYKYIHQELPYHIHVVTEKVDVDPEGVLEIYQRVLVRSQGHKKIVIGRGGEQLKKIGTDARHEIQDNWGVNARLHLFVRVEADWEEKRENYEDQGLEFGK